MNKLNNCPLLISKLKIKETNNKLLNLLNKHGNDLIVYRINSFLFTNEFILKKFKTLKLILNKKINDENKLIINIWKYLNLKNRNYYRIILGKNLRIDSIKLNKAKYLLNEYIKRGNNVNKIISTVFFYKWMDVIKFIIDNYKISKKQYIRNYSGYNIDMKYLKLINLKDMENIKSKNNIEIIEYMMKNIRMIKNKGYDLKMKLFLKNKKEINILRLKDYIK
jgi:hypothetical protein